MSLPESQARSVKLRALAAAVTAGLVVGWLELGLLLALRWVDPRVSMNSLRTNRHFVWMTPLGDLALFAALGLLLAALALVFPRVVRAGHGYVLAAVGALALAFRVEGLHPAAAFALAAGVGYRVGPLVAGAGGRRWRAIAWTLAAGLAGLTAADSTRVVTAERRALAALPAPKTGAPNVLLVVLDNLRAESMSLHGYERPTTPNLDRLAARGVNFRKARSTASWTLPSHASMLTGQWCHSLEFDWDRPLGAEHATLAEYLSAQGYATAGFVANTYYANERYGLGRGFARYEDCYENLTVSPFEVVRSASLGRLLLGAAGVPIEVDRGGTSARKSAEMINRDLLSWVDRRRPGGRPFFGFLNYYDAHGPFVAPPGPDPRFGLAARPDAERSAILDRYSRLHRGKSRPGDGDPAAIERQATEVLRDSYDSCIAYLDRQIGLLFAELDRRGLRDNTLVIVTSDHGEHFNERGFSGHGLSLYRREVHVPLLVFAPNGEGAGTVVDDPVSLREIATTAVDQLGMNPAAPPFPGLTLARYWSSGPASPSPVLSEVRKQTTMAPVAGVPATVGGVDSVTSGRHVYMRSETGSEELYDLHADPHEVTNLAAGGSPPSSLLGRFRVMLDRLLSESPPASGRPGVEPGEGVAESSGRDIEPPAVSPTQG